jgi:UDP-N-acetylmuramyl pentapeptide phosphotransferase/UDP-N-acetylglucosamine-1-phosphate transferase
MFAGEAIGESLRNLSSIHRSHLIADIGGILILVSNMAFLYVWWRAFKAPRPPAAPKTAAAY